MVTDAEMKRLDKDFAYHRPRVAQSERYERLRTWARDLAWKIINNCPDSQERSLAITKLEEAMFWANASIARNE